MTVHRHMHQFTLKSNVFDQIKYEYDDLNHPKEISFIALKTKRFFDYNKLILYQS